MPDEPDNFLDRWSRRKVADRSGAPELEPADAPVQAGKTGEATAPHDETGSTPAEASSPADGAETFEAFDFETLDFDSDYTRFMGANVPDSVRNKALRKLWDSNPVLSQMDGLDHYIDDYTDETCGVAMGSLQTAYKIGQGFLSDEEAAEWDALGHEPKPAATATEPVSAASGVVIAAEPARQDEIIAFLAASDRYHAALYPAESNHLVDISTLEHADVRFLVARDTSAGQRHAIGCGALLVQRPETGEAYGELKRMWIVPERRGGGLGHRLLAALEQTARAEGLALVRLETGNAQPEALALYRRAGFTECAPFGAYLPDPLSVFMEKRL